MTDFVTTEDGSLTKFNTETGELYHNRAGAYTEALQNYFEPSGALDIVANRGNLCVVDACFGLGYNTFVLLERFMHYGVAGSVKVLGLETDPEIIAALPNVLQDDRFDVLRQSFSGRIPATFGDYRLAHRDLLIDISIAGQDLRQALANLSGEFDLVFHDPFSPRKVPELWSSDLFAKYFGLLSSRKGCLLTYSSAPAVRGGLRDVGFRVLRTTGVGGKSGGTLASTDRDIAPRSGVYELSDAEAEKLNSRSGVPYRDDALSSARGEILARREKDQAAI